MSEVVVKSNDGLFYTLFVCWVCVHEKRRENTTEGMK